MGLNKRLLNWFHLLLFYFSHIWLLENSKLYVVGRYCSWQHCQEGHGKEGGPPRRSHKAPHFQVPFQPPRVKWARWAPPQHPLPALARDVDGTESTQSNREHCSWRTPPSYNTCLYLRLSATEPRSQGVTKALKQRRIKNFFSPLWFPIRARLFQTQLYKSPAYSLAPGLLMCLVARPYDPISFSGVFVNELSKHSPRGQYY